MRQVLSLSIKSLWNRRLATLLTIFSIALSVALLIGVERIRREAKNSFTNTISQTDLIVGAKGGTIQLLLYSVFRMGSPTDNISFETYEYWRTHPEVKWTIPYSLGDSHRGYRVVGTDEQFFKNYRYRRDRSVEFEQGKYESGLFTVVIGSEVAAKLQYKIGQKITLSHGISEISFQEHDDKPFAVVGILARTATPIDRSVYVSLEAIEAIHMDWVDGAPPLAAGAMSSDELLKKKIEVQQITSFLIAAKSRIATLRLQREVNDYEDEALMAIIPGVALSDLWQGLSYAEDILRVVSLFVVLVGLIGMLVSLYNSLNERRREMAIFRSIGAGPWTVLGLFMVESLVITILGAVGGVALLSLGLCLLGTTLEQSFGILVPWNRIYQIELIYLLLVVCFGGLLGLVPAVRAYRNTLADGLTIRL